MVKRVVVTGAAGLVGQNLVPLLLEEKYSVVAIDKNENNLRILKEHSPKARTFLADVSDGGVWEREFKGAFAVIELQAQIAAKSVEPFVRNNVNSVKNVLDLCKKYEVSHLVHMSSSVVISVAKDDYTKTKREGEELVKNSGVPFTMFRPPLMFGCFDAKHLGWITKFLEKFPVYPVPGSGRFMRQPLYVIDMCRVIVSALKLGPSMRVHNVIGHENIDFIDLVKTIARERGLKRLFVRIPIPLFGFMMKVYAFLANKPPFTKDQMKALIAGDEFPVESWCDDFNVKYTPFVTAIRETFKSKLYAYRDIMVSPH